MPIAALSEIAVRAIGSSQVLTDPCSVVKELIDNALDARATSVFVEISLNTLDIIQVKDSGYGIGPDDRAMVCRRYCTSKIRNLEDLKDIGGRSLGFRGEALASAAELSGSLVVTTRIEGEPVAISLKVDRNGEIMSQEKASHPVGTTVRVADFLKHLPVRRQTALKTASKTLAKIKHTLQAYAIARPSTRLSLKILKAKNDKGNWVYAPNAGASVPDTAMKVVDKTISGHCQWISWCSSEMPTPALDMATESEDVLDKEGINSPYSIEAFLPKPAAEASVIGSAGYFISIDSRPVTCTRGLLKQLVTIYKRYIRSACSMYTEKIINPFLCMNVVCPLGSYDANVEPAKDDVLFVDQPRLLLILEAFFRFVYGELEVTGDKRVETAKSERGPKGQKGFDLLLARKPQSIACSISSDTDIPTIDKVGNADRKPSTREQRHVDADEAVEQDKTWTGSYQLSTEPVAPSQVERVDPTFRDSQSPQYSPGDCDTAVGESSSMGKSTWHFSMYGDDEEQVEEFDTSLIRPTEDDLVDGEGLRDVKVSNPWTIAKMNSFVHPGRGTNPGCANGNIVENGQLMTPAPERIGHKTRTIIPSDELVHRKRAGVANLQTPQQTMRSPSPSPKDVSSSGAWRFPSKAWGRALPDPRNGKTNVRAPERDGENALDTWLQSSPSRGNPAEGIEDRQFARGLVGNTRINVLDASQRIHDESNDFVSARGSQQRTRLSDIPEAPPKRTPRLGLRKQHRQGALHKPFISPVSDPSKVWFEMEPQRQPRASPQAPWQNVRKANALTAPIRYESENMDVIEETSLLNPPHPLSQPTQVNLDDLMEYEHRKSAATRAYKSSLNDQAKMGLAIPTTERRDNGPLSSTNLPHKNRYEAAKAALTLSKANAGNINNTPPIFADGDPRAYLIRVHKRDEEAAQQGSIASGAASHKLRRARTAMLPLETVAADWRVQNLVLHVSTDVKSVNKLAEEAMDTDDHVRTGEITCGLLAAISDSDVKIWQQKLSGILKETYKCAETRDGSEDMSLDLSPALRQHAAAHSWLSGL